MTEGNTLLSDLELEQVTVLRMNCEFMQFMRKHYNSIAKRIAKEGEAGPSGSK